MKITYAMPVSFDQNCLHLTFKPHLISELYSRNYRHLLNIVDYVGYSSTEKNTVKKGVARKFGFYEQLQ